MRTGSRLLLGLAIASPLCMGFALPARGAAAADAEGSRRPLRVDDYLAIRAVADPRISPDGRWIAYAVRSQDLDLDEARTRIWMVPVGGGDAIPLGIGIAGQGQAEHHPVVLHAHLLNPLEVQQTAARAGIFERLEGGESPGKGLICAGHRRKLGTRILEAACGRGAGGAKPCRNRDDERSRTLVRRPVGLKR